MLDPGITADILEEKLLLVEKNIQDDGQLADAIRDAIGHLRGKREDIMCSPEEIANFQVAFSIGAQIACYLERRSYYKPEAVIVENASNSVLVIHDGVGRERFNMADYNRTWRLFHRYPDAAERHKHAWL
ncbi:MAG: hypothetical protein IJT99_01250 [Clostridia bacterium]|nr:hypothetical protein [Clostridia bacterium]